MAETERARRSDGTTAGGGLFYFLGFVGAVVFFWQQADDGGDRVLAVLKSLVWPAFLVYEAFAALAG